MPEDSFEEVKPYLYRFTIVERTAWDDPKHDYNLDIVVAFLEQGEGGKVRLWYSHHEHYTRKRKNARWNLDGKMTYHLGRDLKDEISRRACYAWWHHCFTREVGHFTDRKDPEVERAKELARMLDKPGGTVQ